MTDPLDEKIPEPITGIFDAIDRQHFTRYRVKIKFVDRVFGGIPQDPRIIEGWLRKRILGGDEAMRVMLLRTLDDLDIEVDQNDTPDSLMEKAIKAAAKRSGNTFRRDKKGGLFLSDYNIKAALKEATAIEFPYTDHTEEVVGEDGKTKKKQNKWGPTGKTPKDFLAETIFIDEGRIYLGRWEPDGTHMQIGKVRGPQGTRSTLTYIDYVFQPEITFTVSSRHDLITRRQWETILVAGQRLGTGAVRSLSNGQYKVTAFDRVADDEPPALPAAAD